MNITPQKEKPTGAATTAGITTKHTHRAIVGQVAGSSNMIRTLVLSVTATEPRVDSRELAKHLGNKHQNLFELLKDYRADFEALGIRRWRCRAWRKGRAE